MTKEQEIDGIKKQFSQASLLIECGETQKRIIKNYGINSGIISIVKDNPNANIDSLVNDYWNENYSKVYSIRQIKSKGEWIDAPKRVRIEDAIFLHNERLRTYNSYHSLKVDQGFIFQPQLGMKIYPIDEYKKDKVFNYKNYYDTCRISIARIIDGSMVKLNPEWVEVICRTLGVDPNFLFGQPSKHDEDFNKYKKQTK